jgi:transcriptional regulator with XRE-family HTH domain
MAVLIPQQIRAARALLGWSQAQLATTAGVGEMTIKRFETEKGQASGTIASLQRIRTALEHAGIEFIDATQDKGPGVRLAKPA